jgi:DNA gyrase subunit A
MAVQEDEQLMIITRNGVVNRQRVAEISVIGRATQGVKLVNLDEGDSVVDVARVVTDDEDVDEGEPSAVEEAAEAFEAAEGGEAV